jgi:hypothetical protein
MSRLGPFDYVIVGAGSAGCVLANRLCAHPAHRVLLSEAGPPDRNLWIHIPVGYFESIHNSKTDWCLKTEPDLGLNRRSIAHPFQLTARKGWRCSSAVAYCARPGAGQTSRSSPAPARGACSPKGAAWSGRSSAGAGESRRCGRRAPHRGLARGRIHAHGNACPLACPRIGIPAGFTRVGPGRVRPGGPIPPGTRQLPARPL